MVVSQWRAGARGSASHASFARTAWAFAASGAAAAAVVVLSVSLGALPLSSEASGRGAISLAGSGRALAATRSKLAGVGKEPIHVRAIDGSLRMLKVEHIDGEEKLLISADYNESEDLIPEAQEKVVKASMCEGKETVYGTCSLEACSTEVCANCCRNCSFSAWTDWTSLGGSSGLCVRQRALAEPNNDCGKPCEGPLIETVQRPECQSPECRLRLSREEAAPDCSWGDWGDWSIPESITAQSERSRKLNPGKLAEACEGAFTETKPGGESFDAVDCKFSNWTPWTACSHTCGGGGYKASFREVIQHAQHGGRPCGYESEETTRRVEPCEGPPCEQDVNCSFGDWGLWMGCESQTPFQRQRNRDIVTPSKGQGSACLGAVQETESCQASEDSCQVSDWGAWTQCSRMENGQTERHRELVDATGVCPEVVALHEIKVCNVPSEKTNVCLPSEWGMWSSCSAECGAGQRTRRRSVPDGCKDTVAEVDACQSTPCTKIDCQWQPWTFWSPCSVPCGGGTRTRNRAVAIAPRNGGLPCPPVHKSEVESCNSQSCTKCIDGTWGEWQPWSSCTATCGQGMQARHREVLQLSNDCGKPIEGLKDEYRPCEGYPFGNPALAGPCLPDVNCKVSDWGAWSACSCQCFGVRERNRQIMEYPQGNGVPCNMDLKIVEPCNPGEGEDSPVQCGERAVPCSLSDWSEWTPCSSTCDGGARSRSRSMLSPGDGNLACSDVLEEVSDCSTQACDQDCTDCVWGAWDEWGACMGCSGQRYRHRAVRTFPNHCGKPCGHGDTKQTGECLEADLAECDLMQLCVWSSWGAATGCARCGPSASMRERHLVLLPGKARLSSSMAKSAGKDPSERQKTLEALIGAAPGQAFAVVPVGGSCSGSQISVEACPYVSCDPCTPTSCVLSDWSDWGQPHACASGHCAGDLCVRSRTVLQEARCGGKACDADLEETKSCPWYDDEEKDCALSEWSLWDPPACTDRSMQQERYRSILQQAINGGAPCEGTLKETQRCSQRGGLVEPAPDCAFSEWNEWSECPKVNCEDVVGGLIGGFSARDRFISSPGDVGAKQCEGVLKELRPCSILHPNLCTAALSSKSSCIMADWTDWTECGCCACGGSNQKERNRRILQEGLPGGEPCRGSTRELASCEDVQACEVTEWSDWDACDATCGTSQHRRYRIITTRNPRNTDCSYPLTEIEGCSLEPCGSAPKSDCVLEQWTAWSSCSTSCNRGFQQRKREIEKEATSGGKPCDGVLEEVQACNAEACNLKDCVWGLWSHWSTCTCSCGGGHQTRSRAIAQMPDIGGRPCDENTKEEIQGCFTAPCAVIDNEDGLWSDWQEWAQCTRTCDGGLRQRQRFIERQPGLEGRPLEGLSHEVQACNDGIPCRVSVDCVLFDWGEWSECTRTCFGTKLRSRQIKTMGRNGGNYCEAPLKQLAPCNPDVPEAYMSQELAMEDISDPSMYLGLFNVIANNLDGRGSDAEHALTFGDVLRTVPPYTSLVSLRLTAEGYLPNPFAAQNGHYGSDVHTAVVHLRGSSKASFTMELLDEKGEPMKVGRLTLHVFNIDKWLEGYDYLEVDRGSFDSYDAPGGNDALIVEGIEESGEGNSISEDTASSELSTTHEGAHSVKFIGNHKGDETDSESLNVLQMGRDRLEKSVALRYKDVTSISFKFGTTSQADREFVFAVQACVNCGGERSGDVPKECGLDAAVDCQLSEWSTWTICTASCGGGQHQRERQILTDARAGGKMCNSKLSEVSSCNEQLCKGPCVPTPCRWSDWGEWSACSTSRGQKQRFRTLLAEPQCGGTPCNATTTGEEIADCPHSYEEGVICAWSGWSEWDRCDHTCGTASRPRHRKLMKWKESHKGAANGLSPDGDTIVRSYYELHPGLNSQMFLSKAHHASRLQDLVAAFGCGCAAVIAAILAFRTVMRLTDAPSYSRVRNEAGFEITAE